MRSRSLRDRLRDWSGQLQSRATHMRDAHAAADAQRGETLLGVAALHLEQQRVQDARARRADRMADRDRAAVDVDLAGIPAEALVDSDSLGRERFVGFDQIEIVDRTSRLFRAPSSTPKSVRCP